MSLEAIGGGIYRYGNLRFDLSRIAEPNLQLRTAEALKLGIERAAADPGSILASQLGILQGGGAARTVTVYSSLGQFATASQTSVRSDNPPAGYAAWRDTGAGGSGQINGNLGDPAGRTGLSIWINPNNTGLAGAETQYTTVVNIIWHEILHLTSRYHHNQEGSANDAAASREFSRLLDGMARSLQGTAVDPVSRMPVVLPEPSRWTSTNDHLFSTLADGSTVMTDVTGGLVTAQVVRRAGGTRDEIMYDVAGNALWSSDTKHYDVVGRLDGQTIRYDSGTRAYIDFDELNIRPDTQIRYDYDAQGRTDVVTTLNDDRTKVAVDHDQDSTKPWTQYVTAYDAQGRLDHETSDLDSGRRFSRDWDQDGSKT